MRLSARIVHILPEILTNLKILKIRLILATYNRQMYL